MSSRISMQTLILADKLAQRLLYEDKGDLHMPLLEQRLLAKITKKEIRSEQLLEPEQICHIVAGAYFRQQSTIRRRCEKQGDIFRPQMLVPIAPGILTRFGTAGFGGVAGYQKETNKKVIGAVKIIDRAAAVSAHCNILMSHLVNYPEWDVSRVEIKLCGYVWKPEDDQPFPIDGFSWDDDDDEEGEEE